MIECKYLTKNKVNNLINDEFKFVDKYSDIVQ